MLRRSFHLALALACAAALPLSAQAQSTAPFPSKPIRIVDGDHEIDCKMNGISIALKAMYVKKVQ